jgi:alkanesulfonate monooxygenase SsuD/methylene tetrahydromethanopterin reductase-like flavin-dependent oxidoreductase (luciferase family)
VYRAEAARCGWQPGPDDLLYRGHVYVAETDDQAWEDTQRYRFGTPDAHPVLAPAVERAIAGRPAHAEAPSGHDRYLPHAEFLGSPDTVAAQIQRFHDEAGVGIVDLLFHGGRLPQAKLVRSLELFGREVLPRLQEL